MPSTATLVPEGACSVADQASIITEQEQHTWMFSGRYSKNSNRLGYSTMLAK